MLDLVFRFNTKKIQDQQLKANEIIIFLHIDLIIIETTLGVYINHVSVLQ